LFVSFIVIFSSFFCLSFCFMGRWFTMQFLCVLLFTLIDYVSFHLLIFSSNCLHFGMATNLGVFASSHINFKFLEWQTFCKGSYFSSLPSSFLYILHFDFFFFLTLIILIFNLYCFYLFYVTSRVFFSNSSSRCIGKDLEH
jgi:hypothetical protein